MAPTTPKDFIIHVAVGALATFIVSWMDIRPLGVLCIAGLLIWIYSVFCPCSFTLENVKPIQEKLRENGANFARLRREKPAIFCLIVSVALFLLMIMGHILSGTWLVIGGLIVVGFISSKHSIRVVRAPNVNPKTNDSSTPSSGPSTTSIWSTTIAAAPLKTSSTGAANNSETDDEFLPEANESAIHVLNLAGDDAILLSAKSPPGGDEDEDSDSVPLEMLLPNDNIPDVERDHLTDDNLSDDEFRLRGEIQSKAGKPSKNAALLDLNTSDEDEEDSLSRGLNYSVVDPASQPLVASYHSHKGASRPKEELRGLTDFVSNMIPWNKVGNLVADQMTRSEPSSSATQQSKQRRGRVERSQNDSLLDTSSDDSEFEILNTDELKNYGT